MIIPTFHAFGPKADTANAFLGGQRLQVQRESIAAEAAQAAARIQLGREQIAQRAVEAELEAKARQDFSLRQAAKQNQDAEIEKAYNLTKLGMDERKLQAEEAMTAMRLAEGARSFDASQNFNRIYQQRIAAGDSEEVAQRTAARSSGPETKAFGELVGGGRTGTPTMDPAVKVEADMLKQSIGEKRREILSLGDRGSSKEKKDVLENQIANDTISLKRLLRPPANAPTAAPAAPQQQQWMVDPRALPDGAPKTFMIPPMPGSSASVLEPPGGGGTRTNALRILNVRRK